MHSKVFHHLKMLGAARGLEYELAVLTNFAPVLPRKFGALLWQHLPTLFPTVWQEWQDETARLLTAPDPERALILDEHTTH